MAISVTTLLDKAQEYLPSDKVALVQEAYEVAEAGHRGQMRKSGTPYIDHPVRVALFLADLQLDSHTLSGALLHDVLEDTKVTEDELERRFGSDVRKLVDGVTKLNKIEDQTSRAGGSQSVDGAHSGLQAESLRKMLVAMAEDVRVILIKLADRLHNMQTIKALRPETQFRIARETLDVYAPLAHRLGISNFGWQLEDLSFRCLYRERYREISKLLATSRQRREQFIQEVCSTLRKEVAEAGLKAEIHGRPKHIYSIHKKMERYAVQGRDFDQIYDLFGFRVVAEDIASCYAILGLVHKLWRPIRGEFDDYVANPRENMYQSLHTAVRGPSNASFEVQIRTHRMHDVAEYGIAAHFRYKEGGHGDHRFDAQMTWLRQILEWQQEQPAAEEFMESVKTDIFPDQVFVYTPKGEVRELPTGATPLDFAYRIHTELGHQCVGAKVNGKLLALDSALQSGDTVEIVASKVRKGPSLDWLNRDLGFLKTANARDKVRSWFRRRARTENIEAGRILLDKELRRMHVGIAEEDVAALMSYQSADDLFAALGSGGVSTQQIAPKLLPVESPLPPDSTVAEPDTSDSVMVAGLPNMLTRLAHCCHPLAGDNIVGFVTRSRGVSVHRESCRSLKSVDESGRLVPVSWGVRDRRYMTKIVVVAWDRVGLLSDITGIVSSEGVNISAVRSSHRKQGTVTELLTLQTSGAAQLSRILSKAEEVKGVISVNRTG